MAKFIHALVAVLVGNVSYFLLLPHLPPSARHVPFRADIGLVIDFLFCVVAFGVVKMVAGKRSSNS